jgi:AbrB family looped-hinge helix DNA binding protein
MVKEFRRCPMGKTVRLSSKRQVAIPRRICDRLGIRVGQELIILEAAGQIVLSPKPKSYAQALRGLGQDVWKGVDPVDYIRKERGAWDEKA